ncbi:MAG: CDP-glucose 4,6-dehydratase [Gammaproteobacteria bacterium RIFCSPHIGHO2_12_FULL_35_23]|nr:MAG: CDP-glucose 4,6-dehydratase [Gammaproteobacteria bacterium RIFCSPHIGHO2_12_FULL_35_23]
MFENCYKGKRVLITGHTGFKGAWLTLWLLQLGAKVYGVSKDIPSNPSLFEVLNLSKLMEKNYQVDIGDKETLLQVFAEVRPEFVFHLAAQPIVSLSYQSPVETIFTNVMGTVHVLEALRQSKNLCIGVIITSDKCYDNVEWCWGYKETDTLGGKDIYSGSKGAAELIFKSYYHSYFKNQDIVRIASARAGNVIGGGDWAVDRVIPDCIRKWSAKQKVEIRQPQATRPWQHVLEPLSGYLNLGLSLFLGKSFGESFNFGPNSNETYTVLELVNQLKSFWHELVDIAIGTDLSFHEAGLLKLNCDKARAYLNWQPTLSFSETMAMTGEWYSAFYSHNTDINKITITQIEAYVNKASNLNRNWSR